MPLIPCVKHEGSYILYIKLDKDKAEFFCDECCLPFYDKNLHANQSGLIHIKSAYKSPQLLLSNLYQYPHAYDTLNEFDKFNDNYINRFLNELNTQITNIQNAFQVVQKELEYYAKQFLNMKQKFNDEVKKIIQFDQFKQIIVNLENLGNSIKSEDIEQNEKILYKYLQDLKQIDHEQLYFSLFNKIEELRIEFNHLNKQQYPECQKLQEQLKSFDIRQTEFIKQIRQISFVQFKFKLFETNLLLGQFQFKIISQISSKLNKQLKNYQQIYLGTRDGLNAQSFWNKINSKSNLLMIFKSKSGYIFGAFSPCTWISNCNGYVQDDTLSSFIFSQTHDQIYPIKEGGKSHAIYCGQSYGPIFGSGHDIYISTDFQGSSSNLGSSYQCDQYQNANSTHLFGQSTPNIAECEIFMLTFL